MTNTNNTKIIFWGTPELTLPYLEILERAGYEIIAVVTLPDRPVGRKQILTSPAPKLWAEKRNIPVLQPEKLTQDFAQEIENLEADLSVVVAYGKIIPEKIISIPKYGTINIHYSLLPRWRGATPVETAILSGDTKTGVSIQQMVYELDAGDILAEESIELTGNEFREDLRTKLSVLGAELLAKTLPRIINGTIETKTQDASQVTKASILKKEDGRIDLDEDDIVLWRKYRAYMPWPGLFFFDKNEKRIKITQARFENGTFIIESVIPEGKKEISWKEYNKK